MNLQVIQVTKEQMEFIKTQSPETYFTICNKQASIGKKKTRYVENTNRVISLLKRYSEEIEKVKETYGKV